MSQQSNTIWTRVPGAKAKKEPVLIGRMISREWLSGSASLTSLQLDGAMRMAFGDLLAAAKTAKLNLPIISLRARLGFALDGVMTLDTDLGLTADRLGEFPPAALLYGHSSEGLPALRETFAKVVKRWLMEGVDIWAEQNGMGDLVVRLKDSVCAESISGITVETPYRDEKGKPNYPLIVRSLGERLIGEELFEGFSHCEMIASMEYRADVIELMTLPKRVTGADSNEIFSMVARLRAITMPYTNDLYLSVSTTKRVWAKKVPTVMFGAMARSTAYVMSVGRPIAKVAIVKKPDGWAFGEEYDAMRRQSDETLPASLQDAVAQREFNHETGWWAGLPQLPTLFRNVSPRTVFEGDEAALLDTVAGFLGAALFGSAIALKDVKLPRFQAKPRQEMLNMADVGADDVGVAGAVFNSDAGDDEYGDEEAAADAPRSVRLEQYRLQNIRALERVHGAVLPVVWMLGGSQTEQNLVVKTIGILFGPGVTVNVEPLPEKTHGLRADLDAPDGKPKARFEHRVKRWEDAAQTIKEISGERHAVVLICAPDRIGTKFEDSVNYFAGIHAISKIGANVHHVLPIERPDDKRSHQSFIHRVQSAMLDVLLAHTGVAFGVKEFTARLLPASKIPFAIYGVQAVRSRSQYRSGQTGVNFLLFSRTVVQTGRTEIKVVHREAHEDATTPWMPLAAGLSWIGQQRRLQDGDDKWLKTTFKNAARDVLVDIAGLDPKAIVLLDWGSIKGLWRGVSDADLGLGNAPRLDDINLSGFPDMTFVRLRRGNDTLSLRSTVKTSYEGWKDDGNGRSATGEVITDAYMTTDMRLVEVVSEPGAAPGRNFGHYVASMGYAKTVQVKRGFSCYRSTPRISRLAKGGNEFEAITLDVASMDASLPAPLDVTVMAAPAGVSPSLYAVLVMGLRLGYAHYNDWTSLPMPLFFERKVDDYIIRYPEDPEETMSVDTPAAKAAPDSGPETVERNLNEYLVLVTQEVEGEKDDTEIAEMDESTPDVLGPTKSDQKADGGHDDLISLVKNTTMPCIATHKDFHLRALYQRIICGDVHVRVDLPYWMPRRGVLQVSTPVTKRNLRRSWSRLQGLNFVKSGVSMPSVDEYLDWLCEKLKMPQACFALVNATTQIGSLTFVEFASIVENDYNPSVPAEEQVTPFSLSLPMLKLMVKWSEKNNHDALLGWLVFVTAQLPECGWVMGLTENLTRVVGPKTQHALEYFLATASAISAVIEQKSKATSITFLRELPAIDHSAWPVAPLPVPLVSPSPQASTTVAVPHPDIAASVSATEYAENKLTPDAVFVTGTVDAKNGLGSVAKAGDAAYLGGETASHLELSISASSALSGIPCASANYPASLVEAKSFFGSFSENQRATTAPREYLMVKTTLIDLVGAIEPGSLSFERTIELIQQNLETMGKFHQKAVAENAEAKVRSEAMHRLVLRQGAMYGVINAMPDTLGFQCLKKEVAYDGVDAAGEELSRIDEAIDNISALARQLEALEKAAAPTSLVEKKKRSAVISQIIDNATERAAKLREMIVSGLCFQVVTGDGTPLAAGNDDDKVDYGFTELIPMSGDLKSAALTVENSVAWEETTRAISVAAGSVVEDISSAATVNLIAMPTPAVKPVQATQPVAAAATVSTTNEAVPDLADIAAAPAGEVSTEVAAEPEVVALLAPQVVPSTSAPTVKTSTYRTPTDLPSEEIAGPSGLILQVAKQIQTEAMVTPAAAAAAEDLAINSDSDSETASAEPQFLDRIQTLDTLLERRLYGLATVHVAAIGALVAGQPDLQPHHTILAALVHSLNAMDCQSSFDTKFDPALGIALAEERLPSGSVANPFTTALGVLASGFGNMLFDGLNAQWLITNAVSSSLVDKPAVASLVEHLSLIGQHSLLLTRDVFLRSKIGAKDVIKRELSRFQQRAENWKNSDDINAHFHHRGYTKLHDELFGQNCPIGKCLYFIARGDAAKARQTYEEGKRKFEKPAQTVEETFKRVGERTKPDGPYRVRMIENIEATDRFVREYFEMENRQHTQNAELTRDKLDFLHALNKKLADAKAEVLESVPRNPIESLYQKAAVRAFDCAIGLFSANDGAVCISDNKQKLMVALPMGRDLMPILIGPDALTPPLCSADDVFAKLQILADDAPIVDDETSENYVDRILMDAWREHVISKRFLPAFLIEQLLTTPLTHKGQSISQQHATECDLFVSELQDARQKVAHAMTLSAVPQAEANRMQRLIEELLMLCKTDHAIGKPDCDSPSYADFPQARAALRSNVLQPLESRLSEARADLARALALEEEGGGVSPTDIGRVREMLTTNNAAALRTASDALAMLRSNKRLPERLSQSVNLSVQYDDFMEMVNKSTGRSKQLLEGMVDVLATDPTAGEPDWVTPLSVLQRREAAELINAWLSYFAKHSHPTPELTEGLFNSMGITPTPLHCPDSSRNTRTRYIIDNKSFLFPFGADDSLFIPPELGSRANVIQCFTLNGKASENDIGHVVQDAGATPTLILARTRLTMQKRAVISGHSARIFLVDDYLIAYAALHPGERLQTILKIGMLTFSTNPFDDYGTKPVPSEMFFGRQEELSRLRDAKGMAVLYGGRRLGKSSLLNQIEQEMKNVPRQQAVLLSMEPVIEASDYVFAAWDFIHRSLASRRIISPMKIPPKTWKPIVEHLEKEFLNSTSMDSMLLMIDESDQLMGCEMARKRDEVGFMPRLIQLADAVAPKVNLRIVIAGLHNVARMANDENSVFGKADPISLQPYSSADDLQRGLRLITKPLQALGYQFGENSEDLPLRILSVCNFYPAFVQLYCRRLLDHLQNARQTKTPPYRITSKDLDVVERDSSLLNDLRTKFEWNLKLDKRYKAIALILAAFFYSETEGSRGGGLMVSEIRDFCECEFPRHFSDASSGVYEALVDEMTKLNILERIQSRYVLRNPNIAMMIGDRDTIEGQIKSLAQDEPESSRNQGDRRIEMSKHHGKKLFPMPVSWIGNHMPKLTTSETQDSELLILTGNALSGIMDLSHNDQDAWALQDGVYVIAPNIKANLLYSHVNRARNSASGDKRPTIMAVRSSAWQVRDIPEYVAAASKLSKLQVRLVLLAQPERALEIVHAIEAGSISLPDSQADTPTWRIVPIPVWSLDAIFYHVQEKSAVSESRDALEAIREASCGFSEQVVAICPSNLTHSAAMKAPAAAKTTIGKDLDAFYRATGIPPAISAVRRQPMANFLAMINGVRRDAQSELDEIMELYFISKPIMNFLNWMGLMQEGPDHTWVVPKTLLTLLESGQ
jgi:hypothetical protein